MISCRHNLVVERISKLKYKLDDDAMADAVAEECSKPLHDCSIDYAMDGLPLREMGPHFGMSRQAVDVELRTALDSVLLRRLATAEMDGE